MRRTINLKQNQVILKVKRELSKDTYTPGTLYIDGEKFCSTLEDLDRGLTQDMTIGEIQSKKVYGETAIPKGTYKITTKVVSPKFSKYPFYMEVCEGRLPRLLDVPGYEGVLIHVADGQKKDKLLQGCIGIGERQPDGSLLKGRETFKRLWELLKNETDIKIIVQ